MPSKYNLKKNFGINEDDQKKYQKFDKHFDYRPIISSYPSELLSVDLIDASKDNRVKYNYIMVAIDAHSRKVWVEFLPNKDTETIRPALERIFVQMKEIPEMIMSDEEGAIMSKKIQSYFEQRGITNYGTYGKVHTPLAERVIRTLKTIFETVFEENNLSKNHNRNTDEKLFKKCVELYNNTVHKTIKMTPNEAFDAFQKNDLKKLHELRLAHEDFRIRKEPKTKFSVNDKVRVYKYSDSKFIKGYKQKWSDDIFTVKKVHNTSPTTYSVIDDETGNIVKNYYANELLLVKKSE